MSNKSTVRVYVRIRPVIHEEGQEPEEACLRAVNHNKVELLNWRDTRETLEYGFNEVFDEHSTQAEVFCTCVQPLLSRFVEQRQNVTVFAYGPTGAGKTFTILGTNELPGIIPRTIRTLFNKVRQMSNQEESFSLSMSYLEIYQEKVFDLLNKGNKDIQIRQDQAGNILVPGLTTQTITNFEMFERLFVPASENRTVGATMINSRSSRSHSILQIQLKCQKMSSPNVQQTAKLYLIDLAGSEDNRRTGNTGVRLKESGSINTSLHVLAKVVDALNNHSSIRIPYRDSKLTRLLQDSLGGSAHTCMVVNVAPEISSLFNTQSTLNFATKSKNIVNRPFTREIRSETRESTSVPEKKTSPLKPEKAETPPLPFLSPMIKKHMNKFESQFYGRLQDLEKLVMKSQQAKQKNTPDDNETFTDAEEKFRKHDQHVDELRNSSRKFKTMHAEQKERNAEIERKRPLLTKEATLYDEFSPLIIKRKRVSTACRRPLQTKDVNHNILSNRSVMLTFEKQSVQNRNNEEIITIKIPADANKMHAAKVLKVLNTGSEKELKMLHGIGSVRAYQIQQFREDHGHFENIENLERVLPKSFVKKFLENTLLHSCELQYAGE